MRDMFKAKKNATLIFYSSVSILKKMSMYIITMKWIRNNVMNRGVELN